jgi:hypothetical protein
VADADRLLMAARAAMEKVPENDPGRGRLHEAAILLERLLLQEIELRGEGARLKQGVSPDRVVSVHDPQMRHGRKSERRRFDGHKAHLAVDPGSQLITAADVPRPDESSWRRWPTGAKEPSSPKRTSGSIWSR